MRWILYGLGAWGAFLAGVVWLFTRLVHRDDCPHCLNNTRHRKEP